MPAGLPGWESALTGTGRRRITHIASHTTRHHPMSDYVVRPESIINQIKTNLLDRYHSGYPILKELLQNADDAEAHRFRLHALLGWPNACNPLLQGPGLLIVNDGVFRPVDEKGILSFGLSVKATDDAAIGKFGFGQKAVFHLCDAFAVHAFGRNRNFRDVVNPFENVHVDGNVTDVWKTLNEPDAALLRAEAADFKDGGLILWLPFRRTDLQPAPDAGFSSNLPTARDTVRQVDQPHELRSLLSALRHLERIELLEAGETRRAFQVRDAERLLGPGTHGSDTRIFSGTIVTNPGGSTSRFVGREATIEDSSLESLRCSEHWPKTHSALSPKQVSEKGEPHGAATLLLTKHESTDRGGGSLLTISWAVFLPVSTVDRVEIRIDALDLGRFQLLLHGYFFLDSGRRRIEGITEPASGKQPSDAAALRRAWNGELRDSVVLPLVPAVLHDALECGLATSNELAALTAAISTDPWFTSNSRAVCRHHVLARVLDEESPVTWRLVPAGTAVRPLPKVVADNPGRIWELFDGIDAWARERGIVLCVDSTSLAAEPMRWAADELASLVSRVTRRVFQSRALASLLSDFLDLADQSDNHRQAVASHVVRVLRETLRDEPSLAPSEHITGVLAHVPPELLLRLPQTVEHREVLRVLASANAAVLPVRAAWTAEPTVALEVQRSDLESLLRALQPLIATNTPDRSTGIDLSAQAAIAALGVFDRAGTTLFHLENDAQIADIRIFRGRSPHHRTALVLSLGDLARRAREGLLFGPSPAADKLLPSLAAAAPHTDPVIVERGTAECLKRWREANRSHLKLREAGKDTVLEVVNSTSRFGADSDRLKLLVGLNPDVNDDREALRRLCVGHPEAGAETAQLRVLDESMKRIERIVRNVYIDEPRRRFLVPSNVSDSITVSLRNYLGISVLDWSNLETLFERNIDTISRLEPTESEREAFFLTGLSDDVLKLLPIHERSDGAIGDAQEIFRENGWPVPETLKKYITTIRLCVDRTARERQRPLIRAWSPVAQINTALSRTGPHTFQMEILDALAALSGDGSPSTASLHASRWLTASGIPVTPRDILDLPTQVDEEARRLLTRDGDRPPFFRVIALLEDVRQHAGFDWVREHLLPDAGSSLRALAQMIQDAEPAVRLGHDATGHVDSLVVLANEGADLALPGWRLLAAVLSTAASDQGPELNREVLDRVVSSFGHVPHTCPEIAATHLNALAELAQRPRPLGPAARRVYDSGFEAVVGWPQDKQHEVFAGTLVPTEGRVWRSGREVVKEPNGIVPTYVLEQKLAVVLPEHVRAVVASAQSAPPTPPTAPNDASGPPLPLVTPDSRTGRDRFIVVNQTKCEDASVVEQREFLEPWKGHVPSDLVIIYLGLIGRYKAIREVAEEWRPDATCDVDALWNDLDQRMKPTRGGTGGRNPLRTEINERRFRTRIVGERARVIALSGDWFEAPLDDGASGLVVGNSHRKWRPLGTEDGRRVLNDDGRSLSLIELQLRQMDPRDLSGSDDATRRFRELVEAVATDSHALFMSDAQDALKEILDRATAVEQTRVEETERLLRDRLPMILAEMKLPGGTACWRALQEYQEEEGRLCRLPNGQTDNDREDIEIKSELWKRVHGAEVAAELLASIRDRIEDLGYSADRVLFELFQNADDAYAQLDSAPEHPSFRVQNLGEAGVRVVHWGRLINHLGANTEGYRLGRDRDLLNMLVMNFSEKPTEGELTGKFGLGFKSVHLLSDRVGIASGFIALRTRGGFLPERWGDGVVEAERLRRNGRRATLIDISFAAKRVDAGRQSLRAFRTGLTWLPAFARCIRRIEIGGVEPMTVDCTVSRLRGSHAIDVVTLSISTTPAAKERALRLDLREGYSLLLALDGDGPDVFPSHLKRLWNLAPLEENLRSGWLLNGPFPVDPGRGRLAGSIEDRQKQFERLGRTFGTRLLELHDLTMDDWKCVVDSLDLGGPENVAQPRFWSQLFDVVSRDFDDDLAGNLHGCDRGFGRVAAERAATPTRLPRPFDCLVKASDVTRFTDGALAEPTVLEGVQNWPTPRGLRGRLVKREVAESLKRLGFDDLQPISLHDLLRDEMGQDSRIGTDLGMRLGSVITLESIEKDPIRPERDAILNIASGAKFLAADDAWRSVEDLSTESGGSADEKAICGFAPSSARLHRQYQGASVEFFRVARSRSGYGRQRADFLYAWAQRADDSDRRRAVLRYIIVGGQGRDLALLMRRRGMPPWVPRLEHLLQNRLLEDWSDEDKKRLLFELGGHSLFELTAHLPPRFAPNARLVLQAIHEWWVREGAHERDDYATRVYPRDFSPQALQGSNDRACWFTMFAIACFQAFGRAQDEQHRGFIERGWQEGWWHRIAESRPPEENEPWLERLKCWSGPYQVDQEFLAWRRTMVDLYTIARGLPVYTEVFRKLPRIVENEGRVSLNDLLNPSYSTAIGNLGLDAAPLNRSLGIGANWMIRELVRNGAYDGTDPALMAPYCWMPSQRVRELLARLDMTGLSADKEDSPAIHRFMEDRLDVEKARFDGDFDLPLQIVTQTAYGAVLKRCFERGGLEAPNFGHETSDS